MKKIIFFLIISALPALFLSGQGFINSDFENNDANQCRENLTNEEFNELMPHVYSFGINEEPDILLAGCHILPKSNYWCVGLAARTGINGHDAIAMELFKPVKAGKSYTITFWTYGNEAFSPLLENIRVGLSATHDDMGQIIYYMPVEAGKWQGHEVPFIPEKDAKFVTIDITENNHSGWIIVDDFSFTSIPPLDTVKIEFHTSAPFKLPELKTDSRSYFYYLIDETGFEQPEDFSFEFSINSDNLLFPAKAVYMGNGLMQFCIDFSGFTESVNVHIELPDVIVLDDMIVQFANKPPSFDTQLEKAPLEKSIELFASGSLGVSLLEGAVGVGASIATARFSASGSGGMRMKFVRDADGNESITRNLEIGAALKAEAPSVNTIVGEVDLGVKVTGGVAVNVGQTMHFPSTMNSDQLKKLKAAYILETLLYGGDLVSPMGCLVFEALLKSITQGDSDLDQFYSGQLDSWETGLKVDVGFSGGIGFSMYGNALKIDIINLGFNGSTSFQYIFDNSTEDRSLEIRLALDANPSVLNLKPLGAEVQKLFEGKFGGEVAIATKYNPDDGVHFMKFTIEPTLSQHIGLLTGFYTVPVDFIIPKGIIDNALLIDNIISNMYPVLSMSSQIVPFRVGISSTIAGLISIFSFNPYAFSPLNNHIILQESESHTIGFIYQDKITLDLALGEGVGLTLGYKLYSLDEMSYPLNQNVMAYGNILPLVEYDPVYRNGQYYPIDQELKDLFEGVILLIKEPLNQIVKTVQIVIALQITNIIQIGEKLAQLIGTTIDGVKWIIRYFDLTTNSTMKSTFANPRIVNVYSSRSVKYLPTKSTGSATDEESVLYIVSPNFNINLYDAADQVVEFFSPMSLAIGIDNTKISELGFGDEEKQLARIFRYDDDSMMWIELPGDANASIDTVTTQITQSASYAVGIAIRPSMDNTAPEIRDAYPLNGDKINPITQFHAQLYESPVGVGIDFSQTMIKIDGVEADALWNPVDNIISYTPVDSLTDGTYIFEVVATDYNGNRSSLKSTVTIGDATDLQWTDHSITINCYPVPVNDHLMISVQSYSPEIMTISVCNFLGQSVSDILTSYPVNGQMDVEWHRTDANNQPVMPGIYFVRIMQGKNITVKKVVLD